MRADANTLGDRRLRVALDRPASLLDDAPMNPARTSMSLPTALLPPTLDEALVARLTALAEQLDGGARLGEADDWAAEFNRAAGTSFEVATFQGIYGAMEHADWVRSVLVRPVAARTEPPTRPEMIEIVARVMSAEGRESDHAFWLQILETHLHPRASDLIYWPGRFFGDGDDSRVMTPEQVVDAANEDLGRNNAPPEHGR
jgi:hypothetical protein